jgi:hypothetical protein
VNTRPDIIYCIYYADVYFKGFSFLQFKKWNYLWLCRFSYNNIVARTSLKTSFHFVNQVGPSSSRLEVPQSTFILNSICITRFPFGWKNYKRLITFPFPVYVLKCRGEKRREIITIRDSKVLTSPLLKRWPRII